jgi:hypothetical protein
MTGAWPLELELRRPLGLFRPALIFLSHPAIKWRAGSMLPRLYLLIDNQASMLLDFRRLKLVARHGNSPCSLG